jgi:hypothetical protein
MLIIRQNQMHAFQRVALTQSYARVAAALRKALPQETAAFDTERLTQFVEEAYHRAKPFGIEKEANLTIFAAFCLLAGDLTQLPSVMEAPDLDEDIKAKLLTLLVLTQTRKDVQSNERE